MAKGVLGRLVPGRSPLDGVAHTSLRMRKKLSAADPEVLQQEGEEGDVVGSLLRMR